MTNAEFSNQFDILYNNIMSNQAPGLNNYEKSVFLTNAQNIVLKSYVNAKTNAVYEGFDDSNKRQLDFSMLMDEYVATVTSNTSATAGKHHKNSKFLTLSSTVKILSVINEQMVITKDTKEYYRQVVPISNKEFTRLMLRPYKEPLKNQVWRLINNTAGTTVTPEYEFIFNTTDLTSNPSLSYTMRYVRKPQPIIINPVTGNIPEWSGVTIEGLSVDTPCELDPIIHDEILLKAVELAKVAWSSTQNVQPTQTSNK